MSTRTLRDVWIVALLLVAVPAQLLAADAYFEIQLNDLKITSGEFPKQDEPVSSRIYRQPGFSTVVLDGSGEGYVAYEHDDWTFASFVSDPQNEGRLLVSAPSGKEITGRLTIPKRDGSGMHLIKFSVPAAAAKESAKDPFFRAKVTYYRRLQWRNPAGGAWFRHEAEEAAGQITDKKYREQQTQFGGMFDRDATVYDLFSGGRAVSENMQLDRTLRQSNKEGAAAVDVASLSGISIAQIDWKPLLKDAAPQLDPLAKRIPVDQHAVFFPSFAAATRLSDELGGSGNPDLLRLAEPRSEDANTIERYEQQLGLSLSVVGRLLGPAMVSSVALTGSDPYFRVGTDVAVLFETPHPEVLAPLLLAKIQLTGANMQDAKPQSGTLGGVAYTGLRSPDRTICSYVAQLPEAVVVTNSLAQLERLAAVGQQPAIASLDEYKFFRTRYPRNENDETAFVFVSDPTIRRWCSARWRIGSARRTLAAAALAEITAMNVTALASKSPQGRPNQSNIALVDGGELSLTPHGIQSSTLGSLEWMTPIVELPLDKVTREEADAYNVWRDGYQQNWRWAFDPIGLRLKLQSNLWMADLTIMPLIAGTEYREMISISQGAEIAPTSGDRHDALAQFALALNVKSQPAQQGANFVSMMAPGLRTNPLAWVGSSVSVYLDDDPVWKEWRDVTPDKRREFEERMLGRLPVGVQVEVADPLKLTLFLTGVRAFIEQSAPGMTSWESLTYRDQPYVRIKATERARGMAPTEDFAIYYAPSADGLVLTLNEATLKHALDRRADRAATAENGKADKAPSAASANAWLGKSFCAQVDHRLFDLLASTRNFEFDSAQVMRDRSWSNLFILNEWKRLFPDQNPVEMHERLWGTRLICPGGGQYVWNDEWKTMESTVYGHPGQPKKGPTAPPALERFLSTNFGLTFEDQGLRARVELTRDSETK